MQPASEATGGRENLVALLAAVSLFLATIEYVIPKPLPFMRLGLANLPILLALYLLPAGSILVLILLKIAGQALIHGTFLSIAILFSSCGSLASGLVMMAVKRLAGSWITLIGISIAGAMASNTVQILLARFLVFGRSAWLIAPPFLLMGLVSATLLGALAQVYLRRSSWIRSLGGHAHRL